jgi:hypothetical protein
MKSDVANDLGDFLEEQLGKVLFTLRERNEEYRSLSDEYEALLNTHSQDIGEYRQAITKITEIGKKLSDIEKHYLFLVGMREHMQIENALASDDFEDSFVGL